MRDWMRQQLVELQPAAEAVGDNPVRIDLTDLVHQAAAQLSRRFVELPFEPHDAGHAAAVKVPVDGFQLNAGYSAQLFHIRTTDFLLSTVAGREVEHAAGYSISQEDRVPRRSVNALGIRQGRTCAPPPGCGPGR